MAVGFPAKTNFATGDVLTATNMNDVTGTLNLLQSTLYPAGRNKFINGDFNINQRQFTSTTTTNTFGFDRWVLSADDGTSTYSAQTFTLGAAPVPGYESTNFARLVSTGQTLSTATTAISQKIENVRTFAGETVIVSFWAKASTGTPSVAVSAWQDFSGGSATTQQGSKVAITSSWARYSVTIAIPSLAGKTIGSTSNSLRVFLFTSAGSSRDAYTGALGIQSATIDFWGVQIEAASTGSTPSPFQTASGSIGGELALCQRYYYRNTQTGVGIPITNTGGSLTTTLAECVSKLPVTMRVSGITLETSSIGWYNYANTTVYSSGTWTLTAAQPDYITIRYTHGSAIFTAGQVGTVVSNANPSYIGFSAEI